MKPSRFFSHVGVGSAIVILGLATPRGGEGQATVPAFEFSVTCPEDIRVAPGASFERELEVVLDTTSNPGDQGVDSALSRC